MAKKGNVKRITARGIGVVRDVRPPRDPFSRVIWEAQKRVRVVFKNGKKK